jgi:O-antigen/teichoic acid export membrane protein
MPQATETQGTTEDSTARSGTERSTFATDVAKLAGGTTLAQILGVLIAPILARLYEPSAFGTAAVFASLVTVVGVVACLRYELAIMLPERDKDAANLLAVSLLAVVAISGLTTVLILVVPFPIVRLLKAPDLVGYMWLLPLVVLANGIFVALNYWNSRTKRFGRLSVAGVSRSLVSNGSQLALGIAGNAYAGALIGSRALGSAVTMIVLGVQTWRDDSEVLRRSISWQGMVAGFKRHRKFPLYSTWAALLNSISWQLPTFLLSAFFSSTVVGYYALGTRLLRMPMSLIGSAIAQVFFQRAAEANTAGNLAAVVESAFRRLVMIGIFPLLLLTLVGRDLFTVVFGNSWSEAGVYAQILSIWTFFWFISSPLSTLFSVLEKQEAGLVLNVIIFVTRFVSLAIGGMLGDARLALFLFGGTGTIVYGYRSLMIAASAGVPWAKTLGILAFYFALFIPAGAIIIAMKVAGAGSFAVVIVSGMLLAIYVLYVLKTEPEIRGLLGTVWARISPN